jgi:hypothetical protein
LLFLDEYIGPSRFQSPQQAIGIIKAVPLPRYRTNILASC